MVKTNSDDELFVMMMMSIVMKMAVMCGCDYIHFITVVCHNGITIPNKDR